MPSYSVHAFTMIHCIQSRGKLAVLCYKDYQGPEIPQFMGGTVTGIPADTIRELAIRYATTKPAAIIQGYGAQRNAYGSKVPVALSFLPVLQEM